MARYRITEKAGRFVAGHRNTGVGTVLDILPFAAEYELRLGTLVPADLAMPTIEAVAEDQGLQSPEPGLPEADSGLPESGEPGWPDPSVVNPTPPPTPSAKRKRRG